MSVCVCVCVWVWVGGARTYVGVGACVLAHGLFPLPKNKCMSHTLPLFPLFPPRTCTALQQGVAFQKKPDEGRMKGLAFIKDPDGK